MARGPLRRPFYAWDRISGAGVGALIFTTPSAVLESYLILHRLKPVLLKTARIKVWSWDHPGRRKVLDIPRLSDGP